MNTKQSREFKDSLYDQFARLAKAIASPKRIELLDLLAQAPRTVEGLAAQTNQPLPNASQHLQVLRAAHLVEAEKKGLHVTYRLADDRVATLLLSLRELARERLLEVREITNDYLAGGESLAPIDGAALIRRAGKGEVTVLDVRAHEEFRAGHLPYAVSIPIAELKRRLAEVPKGRAIVAYCRGPYCIYAVEAVKLLRARGYKATRIEDGVVEWRALGLPLEVSAAAS